MYFAKIRVINDKDRNVQRSQTVDMIYTENRVFGMILIALI